MHYSFSPHTFLLISSLLNLLLLMKPFWPKGTGCGQGFLSAMDTAWMVQGLGEGKHIIELLCERESVYQLLAQTTPEKLHQSLDKYTINPLTRYTNLNLQQVKPDDVIKLYDTGSEPIPKFEPRPHRALTKTQSAPSCESTSTAYTMHVRKIHTHTHSHHTHTHTYTHTHTHTHTPLI